MKRENNSRNVARDRAVTARIIETYRDISGLSCYFLQTSKALSGLTQLDGCEYCRHIQSTHDGLYKCSRQRHLALKEAIANGGGKTFRCHAGLVEWIVPVITEKGVKGFFCSGFAAEAEALENLRRQKHYFSQRYGVAEQTLLDTIEKIRIIDKGKIDILAQLLRLLVQYHYRLPDEQQLQTAMQLQLPLPDDYYDSFNTNGQLKRIKETTYRQMYAQARQEDGANGVRKLREALGDLQEQFCQCIADNRTVEAKDIMVTLMTPAYQDPDPEWRRYEVYKRMSRVAKRLHDYFGYSDALDQGKFEIFRHLVNAQTQKEVRLLSNDYFHLILNCFTFKSKDKPLDIFEKAKDYIADQCAHNVKVADVAHELNVTPDYLNRVFKAKQGVSIKRYISLAQIGKVKELLENTDWSIEAIAESLNYNNVRSLHRAFSANVGITCGEYRLLYRQQNAAQSERATGR